MPKKIDNKRHKRKPRMRTRAMAPSVIANIAKKTKMEIPDNPDTTDPEKWMLEFPQFGMLCAMHLGAVYDVATIKNNAEVLATLSYEETVEMSQEEFLEIGLKIPARPTRR